MNLFNEYKQAGIGWLDMIANRPGAAARFNATRSGLINALVLYFLLVLIALLVQSASLGSLTYSQVFIGIVVNALPLTGIWLVIFGTVTLLRLNIPVNALLVPAIYAMALILAIGLPLSLLGGSSFASAMLGILGYMLYRAARVIGQLNIGISVAFAVLSIVVLVALPFALYMVTTQAIPAA